jgi:hypothetical protein
VTDSPPPQRNYLADILGSLSVAEEKKAPDRQDELETKALREREEIHGLRETRTDRRANRVLRFRYARAVYRYLVWYSIGSAALVLLDGFDFTHFHLPEIALAAIVGGTAVSAIGLVGFVVQGLFRPR